MKLFLDHPLPQIDLIEKLFKVLDDLVYSGSNASGPPIANTVPLFARSQNACKTLGSFLKFSLQRAPQGRNGE